MCNTITLSFTPQVPALVQHLDDLEMHALEKASPTAYLSCIEQD